MDLIDLSFALPLYKIYRTKLWKSVVNGQIILNRLSMKMINEKLAEIEEKDRKALEAAGGEESAPEKVDFITYLVHSGKMSVGEVSAIVIDLLSAGVETVIYIHRCRRVGARAPPNIFRRSAEHPPPPCTLILFHFFFVLKT